MQGALGAVVCHKSRVRQQAAVQPRHDLVNRELSCIRLEGIQVGDTGVKQVAEAHLQVLQRRRQAGQRLVCR